MSRPASQHGKPPHSVVFALALELGVTPRQVERELARRAAKARHAEATERLEARVRDMTSLPNFENMRISGVADERPSEPWMLRD